MFIGACVYREDHGLAPLLRLRVVAHVGAVSYGVCLLHMLVKNTILSLANAVQFELPVVGVFGLTLTGSINAASLSCRYFESVFLRMKRS